MNEATIRVVEAIADDVLALAHLILENDKTSLNLKVGRNTLRDSRLNENIAVTMSDIQGGEVIIKALFNNYIDFIEKGRKPMQGKQPPIDALRDWALSRNLPTDNGTLFMIARAIWRDGYEGRPILATLESEIEEYFDTDMSDRLFDALINELTKYFNI